MYAQKFIDKGRVGFVCVQKMDDWQCSTKAQV